MSWLVLIKIDNEIIVLCDLFYISGADIAFMKPVNASSIYDDNHKPELLTNGSSCTDGIHPAASTIREDKPWFRIDLQGKFYIRTVTVTPRKRKFNSLFILGGPYQIYTVRRVERGLYECHMS